jgi:hypothetical protein
MHVSTRPHAVPESGRPEFSHGLLKFRNKGVRFAPISVIAPSAMADPEAAIRDLRVSGGEKIAGRCRFPETPLSFRCRANEAGSNKETRRCVPW